MSSAERNAPSNRRCAYNAVRHRPVPGPAPSASGAPRPGAGRVQCIGTTTVLAVTDRLTERRGYSIRPPNRWTGPRLRFRQSTPTATSTELALDYGFAQSTATRAICHLASRSRWTDSRNPSDQGDVAGELYLPPQRTLLRARTSCSAVPYVTWTRMAACHVAMRTGRLSAKVNRFCLAEGPRHPPVHGSVVIDDHLPARCRPPSNCHEEAARSLISTAAQVRGRDWRFLVSSDARFVAHCQSRYRRRPCTCCGSGGKPDLVISNSGTWWTGLLPSPSPR